MGLPGAGKTTVAPLAAALLHAPWSDVDQRIADGAGMPVAEIFARLGEPRFRELERAAVAELLSEPPQVVSTGGGWAAQPGNIAAVSGRALLIYLSLSPADAAPRLGRGEVRPLVGDQAPLSRLTELLAAREQWYRLADIEIAVGRVPPEAVAASVAVAARQYGGW